MKARLWQFFFLFYAFASIENIFAKEYTEVNIFLLFLLSNMGNEDLGNNKFIELDRVTNSLGNSKRKWVRSINKNI